jgi:hypothetical protein
LSKKTAPFNHSTNGSDSNAFVLWHSFPWGWIMKAINIVLLYCS